METRTEQVADTRPGASTEGWFYVILLLVPAIWAQGGFAYRRDEDPAMSAMLAADVLIGFRAFVGILLGQKSNWWWMYCMLYFLLVPIAAWVAH